MMNAIRLAAPRQVEVVSIPEPAPGPEDVLVEVAQVGLCGSDLNMYRGLLAMATYPRIPGHEVSGTIIAKGDRVPDRIRLGAAVALNPYTECGLCPACRAGRPNCCQFNQTLGIVRDGAMTRRLALPYTKVHSSDTLTLPELALAEPLGVGYHAANRGQVSEADTVLVLGAGAVGIGAIVAAARTGATVIVADVDEVKLNTATRFGAHHTIHSRQEDVRARVRDLTGGEGAQVVIEAVGLPETFRLAVEAAAYAGRVVYIGYAKQEVAYDTGEFVRKELDIRGSRNSLRVFPSVIAMLESRAWPFTDLITRTYPLAAAGEAFREWDAAPGRVAKILIDAQA
jgi:2-desacetyl-2-hydroxyethyl bacteriochlorophyllide A dehydrogenase